MSYPATGPMPTQQPNAPPSQYAPYQQPPPNYDAVIPPAQPIQYGQYGPGVTVVPGTVTHAEVINTAPYFTVSAQTSQARRRRKMAFVIAGTILGIAFSLLVFFVLIFGRM